MALNRSNKYPGRFLAPTAARPQGAFKNRTSPTAQDGSYLEADWANDWDGFFARILTVAGVTPNGNVDSGTASQLYDALLSAMPGRLINVQRFTTAGTYTPTPGTKLARAKVLSAGGGGGGCPSTGVNQQATAGGGQSGGYAEVDFTPTAASYSVTPGIAGARGAAGSAGTGGGSAIITGVINVPGGFGGYAGSAVQPTASIGSAVNNYTNPTVTGATLRCFIPQKAGQPAIILGAGINQAKGGNGGDSMLGNGGQGGLGGAPGLAGSGFGAGGGGCSQLAQNAGDVGGAGSPGYIEIWEFS